MLFMYVDAVAYFGPGAVQMFLVVLSGCKLTQISRVFLPVPASTCYFPFHINVFSILQSGCKL